ncbi:hypothetical protein BKA60DRAFT_533200 [Fusarium oxysporum]|nr:hypothetical protein BKA60DRAFT_533200 [Fusarium oxysporum]
MEWGGGVWLVLSWCELLWRVLTEQRMVDCQVTMAMRVKIMVEFKPKSTSPDRGVDEIFILPSQPAMTNSKHKPASQVSVSICNWNWNLLQLPIGTLLTSAWTGETREVAGKARTQCAGICFESGNEERKIS